MQEGSPEIIERDDDIYRLAVVNRWSQTKIAQKYGISQQRVGEILAKKREMMTPLDTDAMRRESLELHQDIQRRALELADMVGAPVFVGKDGCIAYDTEGNVVRDYSLRLQALETARKADVEIRKLHGLDAATKIEQSGTIRYEVAGVDLDALS